MRSIVVSRHGGPDTLAMLDVPPPQPRPDQILVDVNAVGVNYLDIYFRTGYYKRPLPFTPGVEGCGRIVALGSEVQGFSIGDRVAWALHGRSYAEQAVIRAASAVAVPDTVPDEAAAAGLLHGMAARYLTTSTYAVGPDDVVLVQGGAIGARLLVVQMAKAKGARVLVTIGSEDSEQVVRAAGADAVMVWPAQQDVAAEVRRLTGDVGVDVVYDGLGRASFGTSLACLRRRGIFVLMAEATGAVPPIDPALLTTGSFFFTRPLLAHHIEQREDLEASARDVFTWLDDGTLNPRHGGLHALRDAPDAHRELEAHPIAGKPIILPRS